MVPYFFMYAGMEIASATMISIDLIELYYFQKLDASFGTVGGGD